MRFNEHARGEIEAVFAVETIGDSRLHLLAFADGGLVLRPRDRGLVVAVPYDDIATVALEGTHGWLTGSDRGLGFRARDRWHLIAFEDGAAARRAYDLLMAGMARATVRAAPAAARELESVAV